MIRWLGFSTTASRLWTLGEFMHIESLETRTLLSGSTPTNNEQYLLELINRARANPASEASRDHINLNEGLPTGTITTAPKQPLAFNPFLINSARGHSQDMIDHDFFAHEGSDGSVPEQRMAASGYSFETTNSRGSGENIAWSGSTSAQSAAQITATTAQLHNNLFIDTNTPGRGHRTNILNASFKELGTGVISGGFTYQGTTYNAVMATEDFAFVLPSAFLTGVVYSDSVQDDDFYEPGEGLKGITIKAKRLSDNAIFSTKDFSTGGYTLSLAPGAYSVTVSGKALGAAQTYNIVIADQNLKLDIAKPGTNDSTLPVAFLNASTFTGGPSLTFQVFYNDTGGVKASTIGDGDLQVTGPNGFKKTATLVSAVPAGNSTSLVATYSISSPGDAWTSSDNGAYTVKLVKKQVTDTGGRAAAAATIGTFAINISPSGAAAVVSSQGFSRTRIRPTESVWDYDPSVLS